MQQSQQRLKFFENNIFQNHGNHQLSTQTMKTDQIIPPTEAIETFNYSKRVICLAEETETNKNWKIVCFIRQKIDVEAVKIINCFKIKLIQLRLPLMPKM